MTKTITIEFYHLYRNDGTKFHGNYGPGNLLDELDLLIYYMCSART